MAVISHACQTEVFPTRIRSRATGFVYSFSRIGAALSGFLIAFLLRELGVVGVFAGIAACYLVVIVAIGVFGPKTTRRRLAHDRRPTDGHGEWEGSAECTHPPAQ